ncbi:hypothetical protein COL77_11090 [Bacillus wiedmannii]|uniref:hypothetical protein n=1 Tax=Bacillus wiedmannii TaxID=1890302 RepID=UPI000BF9B9F3|nr:hypothetical protein [Bacillus wiedmannii]PFZ43658.1 hypothetical protein COL77_11090 [Bacillus wiedmannii]
MTEVVEFLKNYGIVFSIIIGITGLGLGFFYFLKGRKEKKLEYVISSKTPLFNQLHSKMKIYFNDQEIKDDACLSILTIENIGDEPIKEDEFEKNKPLEINFIRKDRAPVKIFDVEIYNSNPSNFDVEFKYTELEGALSINPILFNSKDYVTFKLISTEFEQVNVSGRIIGGSIINGEKRKKRKKFQSFGLSVASTILAFYALIFSEKANTVVNTVVISLMIVNILFTILVNELPLKEKEKKEKKEDLVG